MATEQIIETWKDTSLTMNIALILEAFRKMQENEEIESVNGFYFELLQRVQEKSKSIAEKLDLASKSVLKYGTAEGREIWIPQPYYSVIETELVDMLGHPHWLKQMGKSAKEITHGSAAFDMAALRSGIKYVTDPGYACKGIKEGSEKWNTNKTMRAEKKHDRIAITADYVPNSDNNQVRNGDSDAHSLMSWIPGIMWALPLHWKNQEATARTKIVQAPINVVLYLQRYLGVDNVRVWKNTLLVNGEIVGNIDTNDRNQKIMKITKTITSVCKRTKQDLPLIEEGGKYNFGEEKNITAYKLDVFYKPNNLWKIAKVFLFLLYLPKIAGAILAEYIEKKDKTRFQGSMALEAEAVAERARVEARAELHEKNAKRLLGRQLPNIRSLYLDMVNEKEITFELSTAVVFWDTVNSTRLGKLLSLKQYTKLSTSLSDYGAKCFNMFGAISLKAEGDGGISYLTCGFPYKEDTQDNNDLQNQAEMVKNLINGALYFKSTYQKAIVDQFDLGYPLEIRVGISFGVCSFSIANQNLDIYGPEMIAAARHECAAPTGSILLSKSAMQALAHQKFEKMYPPEISLRNHVTTTKHWDGDDWLSDVQTVDAIKDGKSTNISYDVLKGTSPKLSPKEAFKIGEIFFKPGGPYSGKTHLDEAYEVHPFTQVELPKNKKQETATVVEEPKQLTAS